MTTIQHSFLPDNDIEHVAVKRASQPLVKWIDGHWCWREIGGERYLPAPELEQVLLTAQAEQRRAA